MLHITACQDLFIFPDHLKNHGNPIKAILELGPQFLQPNNMGRINTVDPS